MTRLFDFALEFRLWPLAANFQSLRSIPDWLAVQESFPYSLDPIPSVAAKVLAMDLLSDSAPSTNHTDVEECQCESCEASHPTTRLDIRLRMNFEDPIIFIDSAEIAIEECKTTIGDVVFVVLRLPNQSSLLAGVEHDLAIQMWMSHGEITLTWTATAHSEAAEFKLKEDLQDGTLLMRWPSTRMLVTSGVERIYEECHSPVWAPTEYCPSDTDTEGSS